MFQHHQDFSVYQPTEAARLLGVSASKIKRWLQGYAYERQGKIVQQSPLWSSQYAGHDDLYLGFRDLIEIRLVNAFMQAGLSKNSIRTLLYKAREITGEEYPLSTQRFQTDGRTLFLEALDDDTSAVDVRDGQRAFRSVISPSYKDLEFENGIVSKWHIGGRRKKISIAPDVAFGQPVINETGVPTSRLFEAFQAEGSAQLVAQQFEISISAVRMAIEFEQGLKRTSEATG